MTGYDSLLGESVERILSSTCGPEVVARAEDDGWCAGVWDRLAVGGFPWVAVPEEAGGSGGTVADAVAVLAAVGRHAAPVPLAETGMVGGWLLARASLGVPDGPCSVVTRLDACELVDGRVVGTGVVPWARRVQRIVALVSDGSVWLVTAVDPGSRGLSIEPAVNMAGEPRERVRWDLPLGTVEHGRVDDRVAEEFALRGALSRVALTAGALEAVCRLTVEYGHLRHQFGRPIASFQAVQHHLVTIAECAAQVSVAANAAAKALDAGDGGLEVAAAKVVADLATVEAVAAAHQVHGAMGLTRDHVLHLYTRRLHAWRHEFGNGRGWCRRLGNLLARQGADALFAALTHTPG
jgi:acyl-CoA dehydrogenase